jgi:transcriptional regulator with XRE-family HTH domain
MACLLNIINKNYYIYFFSFVWYSQTDRERQMVNIGRKIQDYRQATRQTIRDLAEKAGLSTAIISRMERNIGNPSLSVLTAVASAIGMKVSELLAEELDMDSFVLRKKDRQQTYNPDERYIFYNLLTPGSMNADITMTLVHCEPHTETYGGEFHAHANEEVVYILTGNVIMIFESIQLDISEGDTVRVPPNYKHRYINNTDEIAELLTIRAHGRA